ncbi:hypothetical protein ACWEPH_11755 [Nocardia beijingensis]|uniref:hypothetical protein n=1 Tax=Nocardia beijingensis TaxID=95162 RepID=UPI001894B893|nr:hypothetical protein [Nocardia beijingensis]MBF6073168.1 hypothetical protein [Nocardia beijingensis]
MSSARTAETSAPRRAVAVAVATSEAALTVAVLYYVGSVYTRAWYGHFGIDARLLDFSVSDYLLKSLDGAFFPVLLALLIAAAVFALRQVPLVVVIRTRRPRRALRWWVRTVTVAGVVLCTGAAIGIVLRKQLPTWMSLGLPLTLIVGVALIWYALELSATYHRLLRRPSARPPVGRPVPLLVTLLGLAFLAGFWAIGYYVGVEGSRSASAEEDHGLGHEPAVVVFSVDRLAIAGGKSRIDAITGPDTKYRYQYSGLLLLARAADRYFLIPADWDKERGDRVFVITTSDNVRIDLAPRRSSKDADHP